MKRLRSMEDLGSYSDKNVKESSAKRSTAHRGYYYKTENNARKGLMSSSSSSSRYERNRSVDEDRDSSRLVRKRSQHEYASFERGKGFDRFRDSGDSRGYSGCGSGDRSSIHRSESFCASRRDFPKGFRSERDRSRRDGSVTSWRRLGSGVKDFEESNRGNKSGLEDRASGKSPKGRRDVKSPTMSKDSGSEQSRLKSPPRGFRDVKKSKSKSKSPSWSKDSASEQSRSELSKSEQSKSVEMCNLRVSHPRGFSDVKKSKSKSKSPSWSKDSGQSRSELSKSEQSKSVEMRTTEHLQVVSGGTNEIEEGELQPEPLVNTAPQLATQLEARSDEKCSVQSESDCKEVQNERAEETDVVVEKKSESVNKREVEQKNDKENNNKDDKVVDKFPDVQNKLSVRCQLNEDVVDTSASHGSQENQRTEGNCDAEEETQKGMLNVLPPSNTEEEHKQHGGVDFEIEAEEVDLQEFNEDTSKENERPEMNVAVTLEAITKDLRDKGKSVSKICSKEDDLGNDRHARDHTTCLDDAMEGPSSRVFELFSSSPVRKPEKKDQSDAVKQKDENLAMMPLDLSLSLPNVLLPIGASATVPVPVSPAPSLQSLSSFRTNSDGFTASMSFSGSQSFFHNPSCSLTQNSMDYEQSVGSKPLFQGIDQSSQGVYHGQPQNDTKQKDNPLYQRVMMNGNASFHQVQASYGISDGQAMQGQHLRVAERSSKILDGLERQVSFHKQLSGQSRRHEDVRSPAQSNGSCDIGTSFSIDRKQVEKNGAHLYRTTSQKGQEQFPVSAEFVETFMARTVSEPVHVMTKTFHEMTELSIAHLKDGIREIMLNTDRRGQVVAFQKVLQNRSDITSEILKRSTRAQLETLVAIKTASPEFLQSESIASSDLAEIFVGSRCRNPNCRNLLEECDCKVCTQRSGFCSNCTCLVCGNFDMAANTCSWVGCDVCLHWCHTDCGIRESYIRNGSSTPGSHEMTEMHFHCVACDHPSEMFGFVKEVFQQFAKEWTVETFCRELEYVKRIFSASRGSRGRRLHDIADQMLLRLANKSNLLDVCSFFVAFLNDVDSSETATMSVSSGKEQMKQVKESNRDTMPNRGALWLKSLSPEKVPQTDRRNDMVCCLMYDRSDKQVAADQETSTLKEFGFDDLESIVKIKFAEAKMFQTRADEARRDAEGLKRIAIAKKEKYEEEYEARIMKLRLVETEELHKQKFEELRSLERAHMEYFNMKARMEADIKDLLSKMEATKRNLALRSANH